MNPKTCPHVSSCSLFKIFQVRSFMRIWQIHFCEAEFARCARFELVRQGKPVPANLLPNGKSLNLIPEAKDNGRK